MVASGLVPLEPYQGADAPWLCRHVGVDGNGCGREVTPRYSSVRGGNKGCRFCARKMVDPGKADELMRFRGLVPLDPYPGYTTPWRCIHIGVDGDGCGQVVTPRYKKVRQGGGGCQFCSRRASRGKRRSDTSDAEACMRAVGLIPLEPYPGANVPWLCRHVGVDGDGCGREVTKRYNIVQQGHSGCRFCTGQAVDPAEAAALMLSRGLMPLEPYPGALTPWRCRHIGITGDGCDEEVAPRYNSVQQGHGGCRACALKAIPKRSIKRIAQLAR